jgi:hypothetical protein
VFVTEAIGAIAFFPRGDHVVGVQRFDVGSHFFDPSAEDGSWLDAEFLFILVAGMWLISKLPVHYCKGGGGRRRQWVRRGKREREERMGEPGSQPNK